MSSTADRIARNTMWLYARMGITMFVTLYTTRLILSALGTDDFGIYNIVGSAIGMLGFLNAAMSATTQRFMSYAEGQGDFRKKVIIFNVSVSLHLLIALIITLIFVIAGFFYFGGILKLPEERLFAAKVVYGSLIVSTVFTVASVPYSAVLNSHENMRYYAYVGILESFLKLMAAFVCTWVLCDKLILYGILMSAISLTSMLILRLYCRRTYDECVYKPQMYYDRGMAKEIASFAGWGFLNSVTSILTMQGTSVLLNMFGGVVVNTAHGIANQLSGQLLVFSNNMLKALNPVLVKSRGAGKNEQMLSAAFTGSKLSFLLYTFFAVPFIAETPFILGLWLESVPEWAVLFVRLVLLRQVFTQSCVTLNTCINATGKIRNKVIVDSVIWFLPLVIGYFLYKQQFHICTIYVLLILMSCSLNANSLYYCRKQCGLSIRSFFARVLAPCFSQFILLSLVLLPLITKVPESMSRLVLSVAVSFVVHALLSYFLVLSRNEKTMLVSLVSRYFKRKK